MKKLQKEWLILPIQIKSREFLGKLLLASFAAKKGFGVIIGEMMELRQIVDYLPKGLILEKHLVPGFIEPLIQSASSHSNRVSVCDEEGIYFNASSYLHSRVHNESLSYVDHFFTWGNQQSEDIKAFVAQDQISKVITTGAPRFDLLRPEFRQVYDPQVKKIKQKYNKILLINSAFSAANSYLNTDKIAEFYANRGTLRSDDQVDIINARISFIREMFRHFIEMLPVLSRSFPDYTIVIRPHPAEKPELWLHIADKLPNVVVVHQGSSIEWIIASDILIHNNCTTSLEAFCLQKPCVAYRPIKDNSIEYGLFNAVSTEAHTLDDLMQSVRDHAGEEVNYVDSGPKYLAAKNWMHNIDGQFACEQITNTLKQLNLPVCDLDIGFNRWRARRMLRNKIHNVLGWRDKQLYYRNKFPKTGRAEVKRLISGFDGHHKNFNSLKVSSFSDNVFCVYD